MKTVLTVGLLLIVLGVAGLNFQGICYTTREKVVDTGGFAIAAETCKTIPVPLIAGGLALVAGIGTLLVASRKA